MTDPLDKLPENTRLATIDDFHRNGIRKEGMLFFVERSDGMYDQYSLSKTTSSFKLDGFIKEERVFICNK